MGIYTDTIQYNTIHATWKNEFISVDQTKK